MQKQTELKIGDRVQIQNERANTGIVIGFQPKTLDGLRPVIVIRDGFETKSFWHPSILTKIN